MERRMPDVSSFCKPPGVHSHAPPRVKMVEVDIVSVAIFGNASLRRRRRRAYG